MQDKLSVFTMEAALSHEKIWFEKNKYDEAEKTYYEYLAKLLISDGSKNKTNLSKTNNSRSSAPSFLKDDILIPIRSPDIDTTISEPHIEDKRFKVKNRNKTKKETEKKNDKPVKQEIKVSSNNVITKNSLAEEVAKARQHIKSSLECVDGIAKLTTDTASLEINNRLNTLESEKNTLQAEVKNLNEVIRKLTERIGALEKLSGGSNVKPSAPAPKPKDEEDDDDGVDLFGSDSEAEDEEAKKIKEQRLAEYAARKSKKPALIAKSNIILDVKPWDDETDMKKMEVEVRKVTTDGLIWGASKLVPLAYGIHKLQISCVVEDDKVSVDWLQEQLEAIEDYVQSVDIAAFNKV